MRTLNLLLAALVTMSLRAQATEVIQGTSTVRNGTAEATIVGSISESPLQPEDLQGGHALLETTRGEMLDVPCGVKAVATESPRVQAFIWKVGVPEGIVLKSLKVVHGEGVLASITSAPEKVPPSLDILEFHDGKDLSIAWDLKRPARFKENSIWVRWSKDDGATWTGKGRLFSGEEPSGQLDFEYATYGDQKGMLVEFWVPQDLQLTRIRYRLKGL